MTLVRFISRENISIIAALLGGLLGAFGGSWFQNYLENERRADQEYSALVQGHIFQFQESLQNLWWRLHNNNKKGKLSEEEYVPITVYALGKVLAQEQVLTERGLLPPLANFCPDLGYRLINKSIDKPLSEHLSYYKRMALAEVLINKDSSDWNTNGFVEFSNQFDSEIWSQDWRFNSVLKFVEDIKTNRPTILLDAVKDLTQAASLCTHVPTDWVEDNLQ